MDVNVCYTASYNYYDKRPIKKLGVRPQGGIVSSGGEELTVIHILSLDETLFYEEFLPPLN